MRVQIPFNTTKTYNELNSIVFTNLGQVDWNFIYHIKLLDVVSMNDITSGCQSIADLYGNGTFEVIPEEVIE